MEPSQGEIIQKTKMQELSSLFMTHRLSVMHALDARTRSGTYRRTDTSYQWDACTHKVS